MEYELSEDEIEAENREIERVLLNASRRDQLAIAGGLAVAYRNGRSQGRREANNLWMAS